MFRTLFGWLQVLIRCVDFPFYFVISFISHTITRYFGRDNIVQMVDLICVIAGIAGFRLYLGLDIWNEIVAVSTTGLLVYLRKQLSSTQVLSESDAAVPRCIFLLFAAAGLVSNKIQYNNDSWLIGEVIILTVIVYLGTMVSPPPGRKKQRLLGFIHDWLRSHLHPTPVMGRSRQSR